MTPAATVSRRLPIRFVFHRDGYATHSAEIVRSVDGWYIGGNFVVGGIIGWLIVDPMTGAMWTLKDLHANLQIQQSDAAVLEAGLRIVQIDQLPEDARGNLIRLN